jgi:hypothetical protein
MHSTPLFKSLTFFQHMTRALDLSRLHALTASVLAFGMAVSLSLNFLAVFFLALLLLSTAGTM